MSVKLYAAPNSSASPVEYVLHVLGLDHEVVNLDLKKGEQKAPEILALNPMGQVPTLVDEGHPMFEGSACIIHLGEKYGVSRGLWPEVGSAAHMQALAWITWGAVPLLQQVRTCFIAGEWGPEALRSPAYVQHGLNRIGELMQVFNGHLEGRDFVLGEAYSLVDTYLGALIAWCARVLSVDLSVSAEVSAWLKRCQQRAPDPDLEG